MQWRMCIHVSILVCVYVCRDVCGKLSSAGVMQLKKVANYMLGAMVLVSAAKVKVSFL